MIAFINKTARNTVKRAKSFIIIIAGFAVLLAGVAMIVLPGPAFIIIPLGLALLAVEFVWARKLLDKAKSRILKIKS